MSDEFVVAEEWRIKIAVGLLIALALWRLAVATEQQAYHLGRIDRALTEDSAMLRERGYDIPVTDEATGETDAEPGTAWAMGDRSVPDGIVDGEVEPERPSENGTQAAALGGSDSSARNTSEENDDDDGDDGDDGDGEEIGVEVEGGNE